jgi:hypothetical protein
MDDQQGIFIGRSTWPKDLELDLPNADLQSIPAPDREAFFDGLLKFLSLRNDVEIVSDNQDSRLVKGTSAPLLIPKTRIFIRFGDSFHDWYKKLIRTAAMFTIVGNLSPYAAFVGLSLDLAFAVFEKLSRLDEVDRNIVSTILELTKHKGGAKPSTAEVATVLKNLDCDLDARLSSLKSRGILREEEQDWLVVF